MGKGYPDEQDRTCKNALRKQGVFSITQPKASKRIKHNHTLQLGDFVNPAFGPLERINWIEIADTKHDRIARPAPS